jgi:hypothetical protein
MLFFFEDIFTKFYQFKYQESTTNLTNTEENEIALAPIPPPLDESLLASIPPPLDESLLAPIPPPLDETLLKFNSSNQSAPAQYSLSAEFASDKESPSLHQPTNRSERTIVTTTDSSRNIIKGF